MVQINWGIAQQPSSFQNALAQGVQFGQHIKQQREEGERRNALAAYAANPTQEGVAGLAQYAPEFAMQEGQRYRAEASQQAVTDLTRRAIGGDQAAMQELAVQNLPAWRALSEEQRTAARQEAEVFGNAAMDILGRPPEQRGQAVAAYVQQLGGQFPEVAQIAQMPAEQQEAALRAAVAEAGMVQQLIQNERPDYMAVQPGGTLVDTRNPAAIQQFGQETAATPTVREINGQQYYQNPETGQWFDNPQEAGGGASNGTGTFQP